MKDIFTRFLFYLFIAIVITGPFRSSWPDPAASDALSVKLAFYFTHYGIGWLAWAFLFFWVHSAFRWTRRRRENQPTKELPVPDTQPLEKP